MITAPYVSRVLEPDGVGLNNFANTYAGYFALVALLGIPTYGVREVAKLRDNKVALTKLVSQLLSIATLTTIVVSFLYLATIAFVGQLTDNYVIFLLAGFAIYLSPFSINWYYQGLEEFEYITFRSLVIRILSVISLFVFVRQKDDLIIYIIINALGIVFTNVWNFIKMRQANIKPYFTMEGISTHFKPLLILFASSIAISIYTVLDTLMLGFITDYEEVGYYTNAMHMSRVILSAVTSLSIVAVPRVSYYMKNMDYAKINELMNKSFAVVSFLSFPIAIALMCISPVFVPLFFGEQFVGSVVPLMILSLLIISIGLNNLTGVQILIGMGNDKLFLYSVLVGTISNFLMNCALIPIWGSVGASISSVVAETLILIVTIFYVYHKTPIKIKMWDGIYKALIGSLIFVPLIHILKNYMDGWLLIAAFVAIGISCYIVIEVTVKNESVTMFIAVINNNKNKRNDKNS